MMVKRKSSRIPPPKTVVGQTSGSLTVLDPGPFFDEFTSAKVNKRRVFVRCCCGKEFYTREQNIIKGLSTKCMSCKNKGHGDTLRKQETGWNIWMNRYIQNAKYRGKEFSLTYEEFVRICSESCNYCGSPPAIRRFQRNNFVYANGIDRKENSVGYTTENSVACCTLCNHMKWDMDEKEFYVQVSKILEHKSQR